LLEEAGFETWSIEILEWGFSDLGLFHYFAYCILFIYPSLCEVYYAFNYNFFFYVFFNLNVSLISLSVYQTLYQCCESQITENNGFFEFRYVYATMLC
jgi:hypothetical protein